MTTEEDLSEVIDRFMTTPEAVYTASTPQSWKDFLQNTMGVHDKSLDSPKGSSFWETVRQGVSDQVGYKAIPNPSSKTGGVSYRDSNSGRFISRARAEEIFDQFQMEAGMREEAKRTHKR